MHVTIFKIIPFTFLLTISMKGLTTILQFFDICVIVPKVPINILIILEKTNVWSKFGNYVYNQRLKLNIWID